MERRKFVIGAGALATGSAAAMGTGAFASVEANRTAEVEVVGDESAYLGLEATSPYAEIESGQLILDVSENNNDGEGVNEDAVTTFDGVFKMTNNGPNDLDIAIDKSGLANPDRWSFAPREEYKEYSGSYPEDSFYPSWDEFEGYDSTNASGGGLDSGDSTLVGMMIDTRGVDELAGGEVRITVTDEEGPYGSEGGVDGS